MKMVRKMKLHPSQNHPIIMNKQEFWSDAPEIFQGSMKRPMVLSIGLFQMSKVQMPRLEEIGA